VVSRVAVIVQAGVLLASAVDGVRFGQLDGGAAPTVMIHVNATDLDQGHGVGWIDGIDAPVSLRRVKEAICTGGAQQALLGKHGDVLYVGTTVRCFTAKQRAAIAARDEGCIIPGCLRPGCLRPGCTIPARWTETHHGIPWQHNGPTDINNGVLALTPESGHGLSGELDLCGL